MASKVIFDSPQLLDETLVPLAEAGRYFPVPCSRPSLERWVRAGTRGVVLESVLLCGKRYVSKEGIARFLYNQLQTESARRGPTPKRMSNKELEEARKKFNLPEPLAKSN